MSDETVSKCPRCGAILSPSSTEGLCPRCLLAMNLDPETVLTDERSERSRALTAPSPETIRPLFPQLEILETLGRGGMGIVYKARQRALDRIVALKILAPEKEHDAEFAARFAQEAQALARLSHPHIVTIHDFGEVKADDGRTLFYLLMEFVDGVNLRQVLRTRRLAPEEALAIVPTICEALQYAHSRGIVHRDIKPENLLLDKAGGIKIADFGIAKIVGGAAAVAENKSAGTPEYMAPEQRTAPESADHRADIYSLGVVLYEMLTGELPSKKFEPPSARMTGIKLDVRLDEIVLRALQTQPELRYHTALDLKTELDSVAAPQAGTDAERTEKDHRFAAARSRSRLRAATTTRSPTQTRRLLAGLGLLAVMLLSVPAVMYWARPRYFARVTMEIHPDPSPREFSTADSQWFTVTQRQVLLKRELLDPVIEQLNLEKTFSRKGRTMSLDEIRSRIAGSINLREIRNTRLFELGIYADEPALAANIANTLAQIYRQKRLENWQRLDHFKLQRLSDEIRRLGIRIATARTTMETIRARDQIIDSNSESFEGRAEDAADAEFKNQLQAQREHVDKLKRQIEAITTLRPLEMPQVMQTLQIEDPIFERTFKRLDDALAEQVQLSKAGLGDKHPQVAANRELIIEYSRQLAQMLETVRKSFSTNLQIEERRLEVLTAKVETVKKAELDSKRNMNDYLEAKTSYLQTKKVLEAAQTKFATEELNGGLDFIPVKIWENAEAPRRASSPSWRQLWYVLRFPFG